MVYIMSGNRMESGPLTYDQVYGIAKKKTSRFSRTRRPRC